ncbi:ArsR family transcriptional regulator [Streptomyces sp. NPDC060006]|uniref:ArsR family transcriptional regulator n=1 Tax=unclassified Streptomyces TaxID=2593676 RepID=UPI0036B480FC
MTESSPPEAGMMQVLMGAFVAQSVSVAARFGVPDALAEGPLHVDEIAERVGAHAPTLYRLLRVLGDADVLTETQGRHFALAPMGQTLRSDAPASLKGLAVLFGSEFHRAAWSGLHESVRTGESAFARVHGEPQFDYYRSRPEEAAIFDDAMSSVASAIYATLSVYDFGKFATVADIGGGNGKYITGILAAHPEVRGVLFDLPDVVDRAKEVIAEAGVEQRCVTVGGSFFEDVPGGADAYVLSAVLHDWDDERAGQILRRVREAMPAHAVLLVSEPVLPDGPERSIGKLLDLETLIGTTGRQRTESEFRALFEAAGFRLTQVIRSDGPDCLVEGLPN